MAATVTGPIGGKHAAGSAGAGADGAVAGAKKGVPATLYLDNFAANTADQGEKPIVYVNGRFVPKGEARVSVYDHGLLYGDGVFEGIRIYRGRIFKCQSHMDRLWRSAEAIKLRIPLTQSQMVEVMRQCVRANDLVEGYIRLLVTRGAGTLGLNPQKCPVAGVMCVADQIALYPAEMYKTGMKIVVARRPRIPIPCLDPRVKSLNYLNNILAKVEALEAGCLEAVMLNLEGQVSECTGDNIFIVRDGVVITPPSEAGILEGVTRKFVLDELCPACGLRSEVRNLRIEDVYAAQEVFLTGSAAEIIAVTQVGDRVIGGAAGGGKGEGPVTAKLRAAFRRVVTADEIPED
ncbi:MAG TPA: branched-chain-amino-acid transaminase [Phycisphaerales bacterium]|nr:branched-chain-amino-acid transaminase [Phycisphaerales bacterium]